MKLALLVAALALAAVGASGALSPSAHAADHDDPIRCSDGMVPVLKADDATTACVSEKTATILLERGWAAQILEQPEPAKDSMTETAQTSKQDKSPNVQAVRDAVAEATRMYAESGDDALEAITASAAQYDSAKPYVFVLELSEPPVVAAHGALQEMVGTTATPLLQADRPYEQILEDVRSGDGTWTEYVFVNPATGQDQLKRSWLVLHENYVFGSGYYEETGAQAVRDAVAEATRMYAESGDDALEAITASAAQYDSAKPYVFVLELSEPPVVAAHGALPDRVGAVSKSLTTADRPYEQILEELRSGDGAWVKYVFANPATGAEQTKRSWLVLQDNYVFGSGYYDGFGAWEAAAKEAVSAALGMYEESGDGALDDITASADDYDSSKPYVFVLDDTDAPKILAHGAFPDKVGADASPLLEADRPYGQILEELRSGEGAWAEYEFPNPATGLEQSKRSWLVLQDNYVFGSGYYTETDAQAVKRAVDETIGLFEAHGDGVLDSITSSADDYDSSKPYVFVLDGGDEPLVVAHGAFPERVGAVSSALADADRPYGQILADLRSGEGAWVEYVFVNPATGQDQLKRSWLSSSGPYIFGSGYYLPGSAEGPQ